MFGVGFLDQDRLEYRTWLSMCASVDQAEASQQPDGG